MEKKKNRKRKEKKIAEKAKAREKAKALKTKLKGKAKKEKTKVKDKKAKSKGKNPEPAVSPETGKDKRVTPGTALRESKTSGTSSLSVNTRTAVSKIKSLGKTEAINKYITGDERVTVKKAATSRNASLSGK